MRKLIMMLLLTLLLTFPFAAIADVDLTALSYDELVALSKEVGLAIMQHEYFDSVVVPRGLWEVGVDIPEGTWIITPAKGDYVSVAYGPTVDENGNELVMFGKGNFDQNLSDDDSMRVTAKEGNYFYISYGDVTFTSDTGSSGLGFKKRN